MQNQNDFFPVRPFLVFQKKTFARWAELTSAAFVFLLTTTAM